jgi:membrane protein
MIPPTPTRRSSRSGEDSARDSPWRNELRDLGTILARSASAWLSHSASSLGAALAFYTLFSVAPILIIALALAGQIFGPHTAEADLLSELRELTGDAGADALRSLLASAHYSDQKGLAATVGLITLLIGATSVFAELQHALDVVWGTPPRGRDAGWWGLIRSRLLSFGLVLGVGFLLLVSLTVSALMAAFGVWLEQRFAALDMLMRMADAAVGFALAVVLFGMIYKYVPRETIAWRDVWIGAAVTALLFTIGKYLIGLYLGRSSFSSAYGAAGSLIVLLLWIYYSAQIFLFGAEFTRVFAYTRGSRAAPPAAVDAPAH